MQGQYSAKEVRSHFKGTFFMEGHEFELDEQTKILRRIGISKRFLKARI